jgi:hypothetical protein
VLGPIIYLVVTVVAGIVLSFFVLTFRSTKKRGDGSPYLLIAFCFFLTVFGPFLYVEAVTKLYSKPMEPALQKAFATSPIRGKIQYWRVTWYTGSTAKALIVGKERLGWGGTDRPVLGVDLIRDKKNWRIKGLNVIWSDRLNKDGLVIPPYR